jgi:hypothetical protein
MTNSLSSFKEVQDDLDESDTESDAPIFSEGSNPNPDDLPDPAELKMMSKEIILLTEEFCRAITNGRVCGLPSVKCTRRGHGTGASRGNVGAYQSLGKQQSNSAAPDGDPDTYLSMEDYAQLDAQRVKQLMTEGAEIGKSATSQAAFARSPFTGPAPNVHPEDDEDEAISSSVRRTTQAIFSGMSDRLKRTLKTPPKEAEQAKNRVKEARDRKDRLAAELAQLAKTVNQDAADTAAVNEAEAAELEAEAQELEDQIQALKARQAALRRERTRPQAHPPQSGGAGQMGRVPGARPAAVPRPTNYGDRSMLGREAGPGLGHRLPAPLSIPGGQDPEHQTEEVYGVPKILEESVFDAMVSQEFSEDLKGELQALLPDVVSPTLGTFHTDKSSSTERDEMAAGFLNALMSHTNVLHNRRGGYVKLDGSWNTVARVALNKVKTEDDFTKVVRSHRIQERQFGVKFSNRVRSVLIHYGYTAQDASNFADSSRYCLTCIRAHELYGRLLANLEREVAANGFKATKPFIDLYATELTGFRSEGSRLSMWVHTYTYLRNLYQGEFWSPEKQELINQTLLHGQTTPTSGTDGGTGGGGVTGNGNKCNHCQGHAPGNCPFKEAGIGRGPARRLARKAKEMGGRFATAARRVIEEHLAAAESKEEE